MVELRKRPSRDIPATAPPPAKRSSGAGGKVKALAEKAKASVLGNSAKDEDAMSGVEVQGEPSNAGGAGEVKNGVGNGKTTKLGKESVGQKVDVSGGWGGTGVTTHDGKEVTMAGLLEESAAGVVVFTYPKASTPGCTTQACLFRDSYKPITGAGLAVYGLSTDSPKSNTTFVTKQSLPYPLLCDPEATLTTAIGMKKPGPGKSTTRGVVVIDKQGTVKVWEQAGPAKTLEVVLDYIKTEGMTETGAPAAVAAPPADDPVATEEAAKLADPAPVVASAVPKKFLEPPLAQTPTPSEQEAADTAAEVGESAAKVDG